MQTHFQRKNRNIILIGLISSLVLMNVGIIFYVNHVSAMQTLEFRMTSIFAGVINAAEKGSGVGGPSIFELLLAEKGSGVGGPSIWQILEKEMGPGVGGPSLFEIL